MRYAALGPGKRLRPFITIEAGRIVGADERGLLRVATAIECIHAYSLIHDDLPCMDDDDVRRGRPTVHKEYDEATAVLAGDALQTFAFELLASPDTDASSARRIELIARLAACSGARGMVGGQMIDMSADRANADINVITRMQRMKTGALIAFSAEAGAILAGAGLMCGAPSTAMPTILVWLSRFATICWMLKVMRTRPEKPWARTMIKARPLL